MKKAAIILIFIILPALIINSCTSVKKEELLPAVCNTDSMSYSKNIEPIFEIYCYNCHGSTSNETSGGIDLQDTTILNIYIASGQLPGNILGAPGYNPMPPPPAPPLSECQTNQILAWIDQGAPKNN